MLAPLHSVQLKYQVFSFINKSMICYMCMLLYVIHFIKNILYPAACCWPFIFLYSILLLPLPLLFFIDRGFRFICAFISDWFLLCSLAIDVHSHIHNNKNVLLAIRSKSQHSNWIKSGTKKITYTQIER